LAGCRPIGGELGTPYSFGVPALANGLFGGCRPIGGELGTPYSFGVPALANGLFGGCRPIGGELGTPYNYTSSQNPYNQIIPAPQASLI